MQELNVRRSKWKNEKISCFLRRVTFAILTNFLQIFSGLSSEKWYFYLLGLSFVDFLVKTRALQLFSFAWNNARREGGSYKS